MLRLLRLLLFAVCLWQARLCHGGKAGETKERRRELSDTAFAVDGACQSISRSSWHSWPALSTRPQRHPAAFVIVHHTGQAECSGAQECGVLLREMQLQHMRIGLRDIAYNFLVDSMGWVYEARGWGIEGEHARQMDEESLGIALFGNFSGASVPSSRSLLATLRLIRCGLKAGRLLPDFTLLGHRDLDASKDCPGRQLYQRMIDWPGFCRRPDRLKRIAAEGHRKSSCMRDRSCPPIVRRSLWGASPPNETIPRSPTPVNFVVVHHTAASPCSELEGCAKRIRWYQLYHMRQNFGDIGYNFLVDSAGHLYEARGWGAEGVHTPGYNRNSLCVAFIGNFNQLNATQPSLDSLQRLIRCAVNRGSLSANYSLVAASDVHRRKIYSPGRLLLRQLRTLPGYLRHLRAD